MIMNEKFEPIKFDSWQELAKYVIDGGEVYYDKKEKVIIDFDRELCKDCFRQRLLELLLR